MDLVRDLQYFVAVAEHRHFGQAAASLGVTQPSVSQGVRRLEKNFGLTLIERTPNGAAVTAEGASLFARARLIVDDSARLLEEARHLKGGVQDLRWGVIPALDDEYTARCTHALRRRMTADSSLHTITAGTQQLLAELRRGAIHLAVIQHPVLVDGLDAGPVITLERHVVTPKGHPVSKAKSPRAPQLQGLELAIAPREDGPASHDLLIDSLRRRGVDPTVRAASTHREVSLAVASGRCFGLATQHAPVLSGTVHRRMMVDDIALRVRIVAMPGRDLTEFVYALDRELLRTTR
jgi:DNA-binding transcriptional LysR family regulator